MEASDPRQLDALRRIWCGVLAVDTVQDGDNFFDLGGDSLLAIDVATRAREEGIDMPDSAVLRRPVLVDLARAVDDPELFTLR